MAEKNPGKTGYEKLYDWVAENLPEFNLANNAKYLALAATEDGAVIVPLFKREFRVDKAGASPLDGKPAHFNYKSLAAHYAMSLGRGEPAMDFVKLTVLSGVPIGTSSSSLDGPRVSAPLLRRFGDDFEALEEAALALGGVPDGKDASLGCAWIIPALPKVPLRLVYLPADEEFGAEFSILYDRKGPEFLGFEALAFLGGLLVDQLVRYESPADKPEAAAPSSEAAKIPA